MTRKTATITVVVQINAAVEQHELRGRGISLISLSLSAVAPANCSKVDAESLAKCVIGPTLTQVKVKVAHTRLSSVVSEMIPVFGS